MSYPDEIDTSMIPPPLDKPPPVPPLPCGIRPEGQLGTCGVCGRPVTIADADNPPMIRNVQVGTDADGRPIVRPQLDKALRMDPETGAVCWCPNDQEQP